MAAGSQTDTVKLGDGTVMQLARLPEVDQATWGDMKNYLENNPEIAKGLQTFSKNPDAMRGWLQTQALADHYLTKLDSGDQEVRKQLEALESDEELRHIFDDIRTHGIGATMKYWDDEDLMLKIDAKAGGVPAATHNTLKRIEDTPLSLHEAARNGDLKSVAEFLKKSQPVNANDLKGISPLAYAISANCTPVVESLMKHRADPHQVDSAGNSSLHYAAGYGSQALVEYFLSKGVSASKANADGETPLGLAKLNSQEACVQLLSSRARGA